MSPQQHRNGWARPGLGASKVTRSGWRPRAAGLAGLAGAAVVLAACGGGTPSAHSSPPTTHATPKSVLPTLEKALHEQNTGKYAQATADFLTVVKSDPKNQIAWYDLGVLATIHNQPTQAASDYQSSLTGDPDYVPALYNLAVIEGESHPKQAVTLYRHVLRLQPKNANAHLNLGFALAATGQPGPAKAEFASAMKLQPSLASRIPKADGGKA